MVNKRGSKTLSGLKLRCLLRGHGRTINQIAWSPDGQFLASRDSTVHLWNIEGKALQTFEIPNDRCKGVEWSSDSSLLVSIFHSSDVGDLIGIWNTTGELSHVLDLQELSEADSIENNDKYEDYLSDSALEQYLIEQMAVQKNADEFVRELEKESDNSDNKDEEQRDDEDEDEDSINNEYFQRRHIEEIYYSNINFRKEINALALSPNGDTVALVIATDISDRYFIELWNIRTRKLLRKIQDEQFWIRDIKWSPDGQFLAIASDWSIQVWSVDDVGEASKLAEWPTQLFQSKQVSLFPQNNVEKSFKVCLAWSPNSKLLALGGDDCLIRLWDLETKKQVVILEGHAGSVSCISFSFDGLLLASKSTDDTVRLWRCETWETVAVIDELNTDEVTSGLIFHPKELILATLGEGNTVIRIWDIDLKTLLEKNSSIQSVRYVNAKVVLVGESGVGKTGLAIRLAEKDFRATESTHGAQFWHIPVTEQIKSTNSLDKIQAELTLWDLAGQPDYHLVHQLFLNDIDAALLLFDCSDAAEPFRGVPYWSKVLKKQAPTNSLKYLISSRCDVSPVTVSQREINCVLGEYRLDSYSRTCAKTGEGVEQLLQQLLNSIPWRKLPCTTTPKLFQIIREYLLERKEAGDVLLYLDQVAEKVEQRFIERAPSKAEIDTVVGLMQSRGLIYRLAPTPNMSLLLLRPELINKYASSIIQSARNHPDGIGAILERDVVCANLSFDGFNPGERLAVPEEKLVLESTVELFIAHTLGFRELGRLVFPSQLNISVPIPVDEYPPTEVTYEFSGSIEAVYASLVICLSYTHDFQRENLWKYAAEFSREGLRLGFVMRQIEEGTGELEIYFYPGVSDLDRVTFIRFIRNHLYTKGIDLQERIRLYCPKLNCGKEVTDREAIESRVKAGELEILCQYCNTAVLIPRSIDEKYRSDRAYQEKQQELQATVEQRTKQEIQAFRQDHQQYMANCDQLIRILHLSDLHLGTIEQAQRYFTQLATDLTQNLQVKQLGYLIISGDVANRSTEAEYDAAFDFVNKLVKRYGLDPGRVVIVPGNHDLNWDLSESAYTFTPQRKLTNPLPVGRYISAGNAGALICDEAEYQKRFTHFSEHFYKKVYGKPFPTSYAQQAILHPCPHDKILFLALNSSWEIDHEYRDRAGIHPNAIANALDQILTGDYDDWLKIAVWHHPVTSAESMKDVAFLEQLAVHGFQVGMHGHIHEAKDETFQYDTNRGLRIIAAGTFGAPTKEQVTGIPLQYNLLTLNPDTGELTVETRKKEKVDGAWSADARWGDKNNPVPRYVIPLRYSPNNAMSNTSKISATTNSENNTPQPQQSIFNNVRVGGNLTTGTITQSYNSETRSFPAQSTQPSPSKRTILILAASPTDQGRLNLGVEIRNIDEGLRLSPQRDQFELKQSWAVRADDLRRALLDSNPEVVHFCGHGLGVGGLAFENSVGQTQLVSTTALAGLFRLFSNHVRCVVLNACYSEVQAKAIVEHIDFVVGMRDAIGQEASTKFSIGFYDALVRGRSIEDACEFGRNAIAEYNIPEEDIPVLLKKPS